jgi:Ricin-type beta-trefoil lectin domain
MMRCARDDRGSLPMAVMITSLGLVLSIALLPLVVRQVTFTRAFKDRTTALNGAQVGLDTVMARVRAASDLTADNSENGRLEDMPPCTFTGDAGVEGSGEKLPYQVTIVYKDNTGKVLACPLTELPTTATVVSQGSSSVGTRTVSATYKFSTTNSNIPGGKIWVASPSDKPLCMDVKTLPVALGQAVTMQRCNGSSTQQFAYNEKLYLKLINSEGSKLADGTIAKDGVCLHAGATHATNNAVVLQRCPSTDKPTAIYQWSLDGASRFHSTSPAQAIENLCLSVKTANTVGSALILASCSSNDALNIWRSDPQIGAGMAGDKTSQLVNFAQFSRCLDVTNQNTGYTYMIAWFCKQSPNSVVDWNQIWEHPVPDKTKDEITKKGPIVVTQNGVKYCLKSPLPNTPVATSYVTVEKCATNYATLYAATTDKSAFGWTVYHDTGNYATSYRILDNKGNCLQPTDLTVTPKDTHSDGTSKVKVSVCSSSELQKWNAPPNLSKATPITDVNED